MVERIDVNQIRSFTRTVFKWRQEPDPFVRAAVEFADAAFYNNQGIGKPDYNTGIALKRARKLGLSDDGLARAQAAGFHAFVAHHHLITGKMPEGNFNDDEIQGISRDSTQAFFEIEETVSAMRKQNRIARLRKAYADNFRELMTPSDIELSLEGSNQRADFASDPIYPTLDRANQDRMRRRLFSQDEYASAMIGILERSDVLSISLRRDHNLTYLPEAAVDLLGRNLVLRNKLDDKRFEKLVGHVTALVTGHELSITQIRQDGLDPDMVRDSSMSVLRHYYIDQAERERIMRNPPTPKVLTRRGTNPHEHLGDKSGRRNLGYLR